MSENLIIYNKEGKSICIVPSNVVVKRNGQCVEIGCHKFYLPDISIKDHGTETAKIMQQWIDDAIAVKKEEDAKTANLDAIKTKLIAWFAKHTLKLTAKLVENYPLIKEQCNNGANTVTVTGSRDTMVTFEKTTANPFTAALKLIFNIHDYRCRFMFEFAFDLPIIEELNKLIDSLPPEYNIP